MEIRECVQMYITEKSSTLWRMLWSLVQDSTRPPMVDLALRVAARGGDCTPDSVCVDLQSQGPLVHRSTDRRLNQRNVIFGWGYHASLCILTNSKSDGDEKKSIRVCTFYFFSCIGSAASATSVNLRATNFRVSSSKTTGKEILRTAAHSARFRGVIWNTVERTSTSRMRK